MAKKPTSKFAHILPGLKRESAPPYQARVDELKLAMSQMSPTELAELYVSARDVKAALESDVKKLDLKIAALTQMLVASQEAGDAPWGRYGVATNAIRLPSGATVRVKSEPIANIYDKELFRQWCIDNGYERQLAMWPTTVKAVTTERLMAGQEPPDGIEALRRDKLVLVGVKEDDE